MDSVKEVTGIRNDPMIGIKQDDAKDYADDQDDINSSAQQSGYC